MFVLWRNALHSGVCEQDFTPKGSEAADRHHQEVRGLQRAWVEKALASQAALCVSTERRSD